MNETLEEAALRIAYNSTEENKGFPSMKMFTEGAKWQQEQDKNKQFKPLDHAKHTPKN